MGHKALAQRYRVLWTGEVVSIVLFILLFLYFFHADGQWRNWIIRTYSLFVVIFILFQGTLWWILKLRILQAGQQTMPVAILMRFALFKKINWLLICFFPFVLILTGWITNAFWPTQDLWLGSLIMGGALLEQINYYYYQLMYDNRYDWMYLRRHRRLRQGSISKGLAQLME